MKFMKIGTKPDTFYTEEASRAVISDIPSDLVIKINRITYFVHKFPLFSRCGLLQRLCLTDSNDSSILTVELHDIPGGEESFELCAKFCYGITITLSAHNFVPAFCAAKFLRMNEAIDKDNFSVKLEAFFNSCILKGWKDSIVALQTTAKLADWSENLGIVRRCIDSILEKVLTPPLKVSWSYTYTRPGFSKHRECAAPKDWWTEDISDLDIDLFRYVITAVKSTFVLLPQLIGEALHVYACRWLPDTTKMKSLTEDSACQTGEIFGKYRGILESIVSMIPGDRGSVSGSFLLRLLGIAKFLGSSSMTKTELTRRACLQLEEATVKDLLFLSDTFSDEHFYDVELVLALVGSFLAQWKRQSPAPAENNQPTLSIRKVAKLIDSYLKFIASNSNLQVPKLVTLAKALPDFVRKSHDDLYKTINIYLKEHPDLSKAEKKELCKILDCSKLSPEVRAHAVKNELLPLRTVVQVLFFEQERGGGSSQNTMQVDELIERKATKLEQNQNEQTSRTESSKFKNQQIMKKPDKHTEISELKEAHSKTIIHIEDGTSGNKRDPSLEEEEEEEEEEE